MWLYKLDMKNFSPPNRPFSDVKLPYIVIYERQERVEVGRAAVVGPPVEAGCMVQAMLVVRGTSTYSRLQPSLCLVCLFAKTSSAEHVFVS